MNREEYKEGLLQFARLSANVLQLKEAIRNKKNYKSIATKKRNWTSAEHQFLIDNWGRMSHIEIAEHLNRSISSIKCRAAKLNLKNYFYYSDEVTLNWLHRVIFSGRELESYTYGIWCRYKIPFTTTVASEKLAYRTIRLKDFFAWLKENKRVIDLKECNEGCFGVKEPSWLKEKRKADKLAAEYTTSRFWTKEENLLLTKLVDEQVLGYREISVILKRTEGSLKRRMLALGLTKRPIRKPPHSPWSKEQIKIVKKLWLKGYQSVVIAEYVDKSALAINGILERYEYFGDPPLKYKKERI